ncbi:MAG TPA: YraN family protein, partial [Planctomycetaceae bacterium]|nr:YraN family protein [Planctomycetaceae bacterium]
MPRWWNRLFGDRGERLAVRHLKKSGLKIVARNYRNRFGEIDIIALDGQTIVFVEVKTRKSNAAGSPLEAVG